MKRLKWTMNDVTFNRSNYRPVIARFDNSRCWFSLAASTTTSGFRSEIRRLATEYGASSVELKYFYDDNDNQTETNIVDFLYLYDGRCIFRNEINVPDDCRRQFVTYEPGQLFTSL